MNEALIGVVIVGFVLMAIGVAVMTSRVHPKLVGWGQLADRYAFAGRYGGRTVSCAGRMGFMVTREPWLVDVGYLPDGLYLRSTRLVGSDGPPLLVPWQDVRVANRHVVAFNLLTVYLGPERRQLDLRAGFDKAFEAELLAHYDAGRGSIRAA